ncbi:kelch-like protein 26 isoform X2 [Onthophagus taurus]|uniref:kelch-like protein 26 isoform X2 n=1 Tax=Onthophagus taurus TaxID=166361 RepID=UPI000C207FF0|nr:kelch-like protein 15 isoform X2 [Onthophagus taurus]
MDDDCDHSKKAEKPQELLRPPDQPDFLILNLNKLREDEILTDITIIVQTKEFKAHKVVLAASSDYFKAMFSDNMIEAQNSHVNLHGITSNIFQILLDYIYTSIIKIDHTNVNEMLSAAMYLQIVPVINECAAFLIVNLTTYNCLDILNVAEEYSLLRMRKMVYSFLCHKLTEIASLDEWTKFKPSQIANVLSLDLAIDTPEPGVLYIILKWFLNGNESELNEKLKQAETILSKINFKHIPRSDLNWILEQHFAPFNHRQTKHPLYLKIMDQIDSIGNSIGSIPNFRTFNIRGMELGVLRIGGFGENGLTNQIWYSLRGCNKWIELTTIPHHEQCNYGTAVLDNCLYIVGGCFNQSLQEIIHPYGFKYDPRNEQWYRIPAMKVDRCRFSLNACNRKLYAVGGATDADDLECTNTCECYDADTQKWEFVESLPCGRTQHAGTSIEINGVEKLYISGVWCICPPMLTPRADHSMIAYGHKIYICGGWYEDLELPARRRVAASTIDAYDCLTNTWEVVTRIPTPRNHAGVVADDSKIYIIGGFLTDAMFHKDVTPVETYDIKTDVWSSNEKLPQQCWEHACVTIYIPKNVQENDVKAQNGNKRKVPKV